MYLIIFISIYNNYPDNTAIIWNHVIFQWWNNSRISQYYLIIYLIIQYYLNSAPSGVSTSKVKMRNR